MPYQERRCSACRGVFDDHNGAQCHTGTRNLDLHPKVSGATTTRATRTNPNTNNNNTHTHYNNATVEAENKTEEKDEQEAREARMAKAGWLDTLLPSQTGVPMSHNALSWRVQRTWSHIETATDTGYTRSNASDFSVPIFE